MQYTTHYNLNLPEGTDIVNPLIQDNPNYIAIDTALYNNKLRVVGNATEVKTGTVHAITRSDSDIDVIRFTATGDWITGDTMSVDGTPVSVFLPDGSAPLTGAYVINGEVLGVLNGTRFTLYANRPERADHGLYEVWTNSTYASFAAGNVSVVTDKVYDAFIFESVNDSGNSRAVAIGEANNTSLLSIFSLASDGRISSYTRTIAVSHTASGYTFAISDCTRLFRANDGTTSETVANNNLIPFRIFGIIHND